MIKSLALLLSLGLLLTTGCRDRQNDGPETAPVPAPAISTVQATPVFRSPLELKLVEVPSQALPLWYSVRTQRPALVLYSADPFLQEIAPGSKSRIVASLQQQDDTAFDFGKVDPVILPAMTLRASIASTLFSDVYWIFPATIGIDQLSVETFRSQLEQMGAASASEARSFTLKEGIFSGNINGVTIHAVHPDAPFIPNGPVVLHIDLTYLAPLYKGEVKTRIFPLLYKVLTQIKERNLRAVLATFSYSQLSGGVPLGSRFIGPVFSEIFNNPQLLDQPLPEKWIQQGDAIYLPNFFKHDAARDVYLQLAKTYPSDAALRYALYDVSRNLDKGRGALDYLVDAVRLDRVFALEYLSLITVAKNKGRSDEALRMAHLAAEAFPENPFIKSQLAQLLIEAGKGALAIPLLEELQQFAWSKDFYAHMPDHLADLMLKARKGT